MWTNASNLILLDRQTDRQKLYDLSVRVTLTLVMSVSYAALLDVHQKLKSISDCIRSHSTVHVSCRKQARTHYSNYLISHCPSIQDLLDYRKWVVCNKRVQLFTIGLIKWFISWRPVSWALCPMQLQHTDLWCLQMPEALFLAQRLYPTLPSVYPSAFLISAKGADTSSFSQ